ncbi:hypothetical protein LJC64_03325 [Ruminococcaceae bacterium OttesenSCG-928-A11]|nr:hypothetical protein [Ruminococcaceae bacterium OttesenSCG-928-A11]
MEEEPKKKITLNHVITAVIIGVVCLLVFMIVRTLEQNYQSESYIKESNLENEIQEIENENLALQQEYYKSDEFLELSARRANKALPGEHLVILPETDEKEKVNVGVASTPVDERSNIEKWLEFLFGSHE